MNNASGISKALHTPFRKKLKVSKRASPTSEKGEFLEGGSRVIFEKKISGLILPDRSSGRWLMRKEEEVGESWLLWQI